MLFDKNKVLLQTYAFAEDTLNATGIVDVVIERVENIVGKKWFT